MAMYMPRNFNPTVKNALTNQLKKDMHKEMEHFSRDMETIQKNKTNIEKNKGKKLKNLPDEPNSRWTRGEDQCI